MAARRPEAGRLSTRKLGSGWADAPTDPPSKQAKIFVGGILSRGLLAQGKGWVPGGEMGCQISPEEQVRHHAWSIASWVDVKFLLTDPRSLEPSNA